MKTRKLRNTAGVAAVSLMPEWWSAVVVGSAPQRLLQWLAGRLRVGAAVFVYLMLGLSPAMADDIDIYTGGSVTSSGAPVIMFQIDSSGSMAWHVDDDDIKNPPLLKQRLFLVQDAMRGQLTSLGGEIKTGLFRYLTEPDGTYSGLKLADALPLNKELSSDVMAGGTQTFEIADGANDVEQVLDELTRPGNATLNMVRYQPPSETTPVAVPHAAAWVNSSGQQYSPIGNNVLFLYQHTSRFTGSQTFYLDSTATPIIDTYLYLLNAAGTLLASNNDRAAGAYTCPAGWTLTSDTPPRCSRYCSNGDVSSEVPGCTAKGTNYIASTQTSANLNSTVTLTGLVSGNWYQVVAATYTAGQTGPFSVNLGTPTAGTLYKQAAVAAKKQRVGLRFPTIRIPQGATISNAYLEFQASGASNVTTALAVGVDTAAAPADFLGQGLFTRTLAWGADQTVAAWTDGLRDATTRLNVTGRVASRVADTNWCNSDLVFVIEGKGGDLDERIAHAYESNTGAPPRLVVTWSPPAASSGACNRKEFVWDIVTSTEDVYQKADGTQVLDSTFLEVNTAQKAGLRFTLLPVPAGVTVESATLELVAHENASPGKLYLNAINEPKAKPFGAKVSALDARQLLGPTVEWTPPNWTAGQRYTHTSPALKQLIQAALNNGWERDGTIGLVISGAQAAPMRIRAWERTASGSASTVLADFGQYSARLRVTVTSPTSLGTVKTHRREMVEQVLAIQARGATPISGAYLEVAQYLLGRDGYATPPGKLPELATGKCSNNATIMLTDGDEALGSGNRYPDSFKTAVEAITGKNCAASVDAWPCTYDMMDTLFNEKAPFVAASDGNVYSVRTHTVGFGPIAKVGGGKLNASGQHGGGDYYPATSSASLIDIFDKIITSTIQAGTVAAPGVSVNALNRFEHLDELYYSLFKPSGTVDWKGNIKRYRLKDSTIVDVTGTAAVDNSASIFVSTSESWWSSGQDGVAVTAGGAANEIVQPDPPARLVYTYLGDNGSRLNQTLHPADTVSKDGLAGEALILDNTYITPEKLGVDRLPGYAAMTGAQITAQRDQVLTYMRGGTNALPRLAFGSTIHASPAIVTYGVDTNGTADPADDAGINTLFVGDNGGVLHMIDSGGKNSDVTATNQANAGGKELFAFIPQELLRNGALLESNTQKVAAGYIYGLDARWRVWRKDLNGDRKIDVAAGDHVHIYGGMRRGGKNIYALDVSKMRRDKPVADRDPRLLWTVEGGATGPYAGMGQSWSDPQSRQILWGGAPRQVVLFGGGYDAAVHDGSQALTSSTQLGSQVYMVDALTGDLLWRASSVTGADTVVGDMKYSVTAAPIILDRNGNQSMDGFYIVDLAGQIFRFDLNENATSAATLVKRAVVVAKLGATPAGADTTLDNRRFYEAPAVSYVDSPSGGDLLIAVVSGYREKPRDGVTKEMAFMVRDIGAWNLDPGAPRATLLLANLKPIDSATLTGADLTGPGWYLTLPAAAEKGMGTPVFYKGAVLFTTYVPGAAAAATECAPAIGATRLYIVNALSGEGLADINSTARYIDNMTPGIAGSPQVIYGANGERTLLVGTAALDSDRTKLGSGSGDDYRRLRWFEVNP